MRPLFRFAIGDVRAAQRGHEHATRAAQKEAEAEAALALVGVSEKLYLWTTVPPAADGVEYQNAAIPKRVTNQSLYTSHQARSYALSLHTSLRLALLVCA